MATRIIANVGAGLDYPTIVAWNADFNPQTPTVLWSSRVFLVSVFGSVVSGAVLTGAGGVSAQFVGKVLGGYALLRNISGTLASGMTLNGAGGAFFTLLDAGDLAVVVCRLHAQRPIVEDQIDLYFANGTDSFPRVEVADQAMIGLQHVIDATYVLQPPAGQSGYVRSNSYRELYGIHISYEPPYLPVAAFDLGGAFAVNCSVGFGALVGFDNVGYRLINGAIFEACAVGIRQAQFAASRVYNCSVYDAQVAYEAQNGSTTGQLINCYGNSEFQGLWTLPGDWYNASGSTSVPPGNFARANVAPDFDAYYKPTQADTELRGQGVYLGAGSGADFEFDYDITGTLRNQPWSVGALQAVGEPPPVTPPGVLAPIFGGGVGFVPTTGNGGNMLGAITGGGDGAVNRVGGIGGGFAPQAVNHLGHTVGLAIFGVGSGDVFGDGGFGGGSLRAVHGKGKGSVDSHGHGVGMLSAIFSGNIDGNGGFQMRDAVFGGGVGTVSAAPLTSLGLTGGVAAFRLVPTYIAPEVEQPLLGHELDLPDATQQNAAVDHPHKVFTQAQADWLQHELIKIKDEGNEEGG